MTVLEVIPNAMRGAAENQRPGNRKVYYSAWAKDLLSLRDFPAEEVTLHGLVTRDAVGAPVHFTMDRITYTYLQMTRYAIEWDRAAYIEDKRLDCVALHVLEHMPGRPMAHDVVSWADFYARFCLQFADYDSAERNTTHEVIGAPKKSVN